MDYNESLLSIYSRKDRDLIIHNPTYMYSIMLDNVASSSRDVRLVKALFEFMRLVDVFELFSSNGVQQALKTLVPYKDALKGKAEEVDIKLSMRGVASLFDEHYFDGIPLVDSKKNAAAVKTSNPKRSPKRSHPSNKISPSNQTPTPSPKARPAQAKKPPLLTSTQANGNGAQANPKKPKTAPKKQKAPQLELIDMNGIEKVVVNSKNAAVHIWNGGLNGVMLKGDKIDSPGVKMTITRKNLSKTVVIDLSCNNKAKSRRNVMTLELDLSRLKDVSVTSNMNVDFKGRVIGEVDVDSEKCSFSGQAQRLVIKTHGDIDFSGQVGILNCCSNTGDIRATGKAAAGKLYSKRGKIRCSVSCPNMRCIC